MTVRKSIKLAFLFLLVVYGLSFKGCLDYTTEKDVRCKVIDKIITHGGYKDSGKFYFVLSDDQGRVFDIIVSASTYSTSSVGEYKYFSLRESDIHQTETKNFVFVLVPIICFSIFISIIIVLIVVRILKAITSPASESV